jgi:hypothetical protein
MGDEELNFTEKEAQGWADDPRNQAHKTNPLLSLIIVLFLIALVAYIVAVNSGRSVSNGGQNHIGVLFVQ